MSEVILYKARQNKILLILKILRVSMFSVLVSFLIGFFLNPYFALLILIILIAVSTLYYYILWSNSYVMISNYQISIKVRNELFSSYQINLAFNEIKDTAYSKNNLFHFIFNYGTFFARSKIDKDHNILLEYVCDIEKIFDLVNKVFQIKPEQREKLKNIDELYVTNKKTKEEIIELEKNNLLSIKGIREVYEIIKDDRKYIFENEEDRNHGVYETIKRDVIFCATHDDTFRDPDSAIVHKVGEKVIFPGIGFHEVKQKNVVSSSPGEKVHEFLVSKLKDFKDDDATLLIGFDL